jgi:pyruvate/oxaloacetate carboxyltransferase
LQGKDGVWIKLPIELVNLVEIAVKVIFPYSISKFYYITTYISILEKLIKVTYESICSEVVSCLF